MILKPPSFFRIKLFQGGQSTPARGPQLSSPTWLIAGNNWTEFSFVYLNEIKKMVPKVKMKLIVLSNQGQDQDIEEAKKAGAIGYIIKAQSIPSEVVKKVEKIMSAK